VNPARTIAQRELRNENAKVIEAVTAGETFIVTRHGEPVAELRPAELTAGPHLATDAVNRRNGRIGCRRLNRRWNRSHSAEPRSAATD